MQFPRREGELVQLAEDVAKGLTNHAEVFPRPCALPDAIVEALAVYQEARAEALELAGRALQVTFRKREALKELRRLVKPNLVYARYADGPDGAHLGLIGWGLPRKPTWGLAERAGISYNGEGYP
ncbi:MAG: hypothetical protein WD934_08465 [Gemmatimonadales bacterium]